MKQKRQNGAGGMVQSSDISTTQYSGHTIKWPSVNKEDESEYKQNKKVHSKK